MENENIVRTVIHTGQQPAEAQIRETEAVKNQAGDCIAYFTENTGPVGSKIPVA